MADRMATGGDASLFPPAELEALPASSGAAIDACGGSVTMPYAAVVLTAACIETT